MVDGKRARHGNVQRTPSNRSEAQHMMDEKHAVGAAKLIRLWSGGPRDG